MSSNASKEEEKNKLKGSTAEFIHKCHWLRVRERIIFKICLLVHKCLYGSAPKCLKEMLQYSGSNRTMKLIQPTHKGTYGSRCFARVAPKLWNLLQLHLRTENDVGKFKKSLKTFLFDGFYDFQQKLKEKWWLTRIAPLSVPTGPQDPIDCPTFSVTWLGNFPIRLCRKGSRRFVVMEDFGWKRRNWQSWRTLCT